MIRNLLLVAAGGALGSILRALVITAAPFPWGTLAVNVSGSFVIGVLFALLAGTGEIWTILFISGLLGGFTTFSTFSLDVLRLVESGRAPLAGGYVMLSVALSLGACWAGLLVGRSLP
ncbi:CrcB family protein [Rubellimicrobium sp. CFH 75288]|uniref:fluoride efflux transporter FluC n=1 Tax=Rubellimicrobium sp. CFH 75288 TaxID=2697034 RepID=UPI001AA18608|nr:CrcB family protein [Rubellimicrobium sp. CFH 75288]